MCLPEYDLPKFGLRSAIMGVRTSHASPAVPRVDWGSPFSQSSRDGSRTVGGQSFAGSGYGSRHSLAAGRWSDADEFGRFGPVYALAAGDGMEVDRVVSRSSGLSGGGSGSGCSWSSCLPRFRADGGDGAVAALVGSATAPLVSRTILDLFHLGLELYMYVLGFC